MAETYLEPIPGETFAQYLYSKLFESYHIIKKVYVTFIDVWVVFVH